jgi:hypothetical protein
MAEGLFEKRAGLLSPSRRSGPSAEGESTGLPWLSVWTIAARQRRRAVGSGFRRQDGGGLRFSGLLIPRQTQGLGCVGQQIRPYQCHRRLYRPIT